MRCPKCGEERDCLSCRFVKETPYETICLEDHYGVTIGEGCDDWRCKKCALKTIEELSGALKRLRPDEREAFLDAAQRRTLF